MLATVEAIGTCRRTIEQFVQAFFWGALGRQPTASELTTRSATLRTAQGQGQAQLLAAAKTLGTDLFTSAAYNYAGRSRSDRDYIHDLYWAYLQRAPEEDGYARWLKVINDCQQPPTCDGRAVTRSGFAESVEFSAIVAALCVNPPQEQTLWQMTDHTGSVRVMLDQAGQVAGRHDYLPFGDQLSAGAPMPQALMGDSTTGLHNWPNTILTRFAEMERDAATGLDHTQFRKYDAWGGRWTSPDPYLGSMSLADPQSFNRYSYVQNDPVNFVDPTGLSEWPKILSRNKLTQGERPMSDKL